MAELAVNADTALDAVNAYEAEMDNDELIELEAVKADTALLAVKAYEELIAFKT